MKSTKLSPALSQETISLRAHALWVQQGSPAGQDLAIWLQAEIELSDARGVSAIDRERLQEFLDSFGAVAPSRSPTSLG